MVSKTRLIILGHGVVLEIGKNGTKVPILERLGDRSHYTGPGKFDVVVNFGSLFMDLGMRGTRVALKHRWSAKNPPPKGIRIVEFSDPKIRAAVQLISKTASECSNEDVTACNKYFKLNKKVYDALRTITGIDPTSTKFLGLVRAGVVAGQMLGVSLEDQILIQTKRLRLKGNKDGFVSVGISYFNKGDIKKLSHQHWLIGDPAGATYGSTLANLIYLAHLGIKPKRVSIWNAVATHKGSVFALEALKELGIQGEIVAGGYAPGMNAKYYLETPEGYSSVGDAGDWLNRFLNLESVIVPRI